MSVNGGAFTPTGNNGLFTRIEPGVLNCPFAPPYTSTLFGILPGVGDSYLIPYCSLEAEPGNLILDFEVRLVDDDSGAEVVVYTTTYLPAENFVSTASINCTNPAICTSGQVDSDKLAEGDWSLVYEATFQSGGTNPAYPFTRLSLLRSILRLIDALEVVEDDVEATNAPLAAQVDAAQEVLVHARYALEADQLATVRAALAHVNDQVLIIRDDGDVSSPLKTLLNVQQTELNRGLIIYVDEEVFGGVAATDTTPAGDRYDDAVAYEDASANGNPASSLHEAVLHHTRNTDSRIIVFEAGIGSGATPDLADITRLYDDIYAEASALYGAIESANSAIAGSMFGETEILAVRDLVDDIRADMASAGVGTLTNEEIAYMVNDQFNLIGLLRDANSEYLGTWAMRQRAVYGVYSAVRVVIPNSSQNIVGGNSNPLIVEAYRRWNVMATEVDEFLDPAHADYLLMTRLVTFVIMATAESGDWLTLGDPGSPTPVNGLGQESNRCFIGQVANGAYVPDAKLPKGSDSLEFYPGTEPIVFPGCSYDPCSVNWYDRDPSCP